MISVILKKKKNLKELLDRVPSYRYWNGVVGSELYQERLFLYSENGMQEVPLLYNRREESTPSYYYEEEGAPIKESLPHNFDEKGDFLLLIKEEFVSYDSSRDCIVLEVYPLR
jgi:hypothetical protein